MITTKLKGFTLRFATEQDIPVILSLIKELAVYEKMLEDVEATEETLYNSMFTRKVSESIVAEFNGQVVGYMSFFYNFSTFTGRAGIYLEDIYVKREMRGKGFGKLMLTYLAKLAVERDCARVEWCCLDWNEPSKQFYKSLGANEKSEWRSFRLDKEALAELATKFE